MPLPAALLGRLRARHLALVVALDTHRSLRRAAAEIALTQPAVTKLLRDLEDALGARLFERHPWGMSPTPYGETLVRHARGILNDLAQASADIAAQREGAQGSLRVGGVTGSVPRFVAPAIGAPRAARAVARACASNRLALVVPCHRVVREDGSIGGYRWGIARKQRLLAREREVAPAAS